VGARFSAGAHHRRRHAAGALGRRPVIGHELGHLLPGTLRAGSVLQRTLVVGGLAVMAVTVLVLLVVAVPRGWAAIPGGPAWNWGLFGIFAGMVLAIAGLLAHSRDTETACDRASALIYGQTMSEEHVAYLVRREGLLNRLAPTVFRTHPRPGWRREQVLAVHSRSAAGGQVGGLVQCALKPAGWSPDQLTAPL